MSRSGPLLGGETMMTINVSHSVEIVVISAVLWATVVYTMVRVTRN